jgi:hypothetical protein
MIQSVIFALLLKKTAAGFGSPTPWRTHRLFIMTWRFFYVRCSACFLAVEQEDFGLAVPWCGLPTCLTAIFRLEAENGEYYFTKEQSNGTFNQQHKSRSATPIPEKTDDRPGSRTYLQNQQP